jgi:preprotein translocase subunit SecF
MQLFRDTHIDFMRYRRLWLSVSAVLLVVPVVLAISGHTLNLGIDFAGGTQLTVKFADPPQVDEVRQLMAGAGVSDVSIQRFGEPEENSVIIKTRLAEEAEEGNRAHIVAALQKRYGSGSGLFDLNESGAQGLASKLVELDPDQLLALDETEANDHYTRVATAVNAAKQEVGLLTSWDQVESVPEVSPEALAALRQAAELGKFRIVGSESVGPQIGAELRRSGIWAVVFALIGMLAYIWIRFELRFGVGAMLAVAHDVLITLGLFAAVGLEFNLTTIAGFLTLVGYSVNDTVVVFDRVRENLQQNRRADLVTVMNQSINQTLSRTVLTSGTTLLTVGCLLFLGGDVLRGFAFILTFGIIIGTYSSIYIASPFALLWERWFGAQARSARRASQKT